MAAYTTAWKIRLLDEIGTAYRDLFPERYAEALRIVKEARHQLTTEAGVSQGGTLSWRARIPTELFLFIRRYWPEFGQDYRDLDLLCRVWPDLRVATR